MDFVEFGGPETYADELFVCHPDAPIDAVHHAAWDGDVEEVVRLIGEWPQRLRLRVYNVPAVMLGGEIVCTKSPLELAICRVYEALVERLLALGADVDIRGPWGWIALMSACMDKKASILNMLLKAGAPANSRDSDGITPLIAAAGMGSPECVALLLAQWGIVLEAKEFGQGRTAAHFAAGKETTTGVLDPCVLSSLRSLLLPSFCVLFAIYAFFPSCASKHITKTLYTFFPPSPAPIPTPPRTEHISHL